MNILLHYAFLSIIPAVIIMHLFVSPYTKVEESFNIQAVHDILTYGIPSSDARDYLADHYDHVEFSGSVPRTFVGAVILSTLARPFRGFCRNGREAQILVRGVLGLVNAFSLLALQQAVNQAYGKVAGYWFIILQASQFHVMYYASRTLPNSLASPFVMLSLRCFILAHFGNQRTRSRRCRIALGLLTVAGVIFRSELAILLAHMSLVVFLSLRQSPLTIAFFGVFAAASSAYLSVKVDSFFWQQNGLWPELEALKFNTVQGKASEWGTSPWHWYFTNSIPKLMMNPLSLSVCIPIALLQKSTQRFSLDLVYPLVAFIGTYSLLPHKEWRFIVYTIPGLNAVASAGASWIWTRKNRSPFWNILNLTLIGSVIGTLMASVVLLCISSLNYPGAEALRQLQDIGRNESRVLNVHLDNLSCQSGVTRYLQMDSASSDKETWIYDKTEDPEDLMDLDFWTQFDYVLAEDPSTVLGNWEVVQWVSSFQKLKIGDGINLGAVTCRMLLGVRGDSVCDVVDSVESRIAKRLTRGRWPRITLAERIAIMKQRNLE